MKIAFTLTILAAGLLLAAGNLQVDASKKIRELHKERIATLKQLFEAATAEYETGASTTTSEHVSQARLALLNAELDACESDQGRVNIHTSIVELLKENETRLDASVNTGNGSKKELLKSKAERLKAEIALEEAKGKGVAKQAP